VLYTIKSYAYDPVKGAADARQEVRATTGRGARGFACCAQKRAVTSRGHKPFAVMLHTCASLHALTDMTKRITRVQYEHTFVRARTHTHTHTHNAIRLASFSRPLRLVR
jgi:hypothetical protein